MRRGIEFCAAIAFTVGSLAGCGSSEVTQDANVVGFAQGIEADVLAFQTVHHEDEADAPGNAFNIDEDRYFAGCEEESNDFSIQTWDDFECSDDSEDEFDSNYCVSDEDSHCEARYIFRYDYDAREEVAIGHCSADYPRREFKTDPDQDEMCLNNPPANARLRKFERFVIWVTTKNPEHDEDHPNAPATITNSVEVKYPVWSRAERNVPFTATVRDGKIVDAVPK